MDLSWISIIWSMAMSASLTLAAIHLVVWLQGRTAGHHLLFFFAATAVAAMACCELWMMRAETPGQYANAIRWLHVPAFIIVVALTGFVLLYLRAGRRPLAWALCLLRALSLVVNFLVGQNLNYLEITDLRSVAFLGELVAVSRGHTKPVDADGPDKLATSSQVSYWTPRSACGDAVTGDSPW